MPEPDTRLCGLRETHDEPCPVPDLALDLDPPLVQLHNAMNLGQPQPGAFFFVVKNGRKILSKFCLRMPSPLSWNAISMTSDRRPPTSTRRTPVAIVSVPPADIASKALVAKFQKTCFSWS